jgi:hypothetical protein
MDSNFLRLALGLPLLAAIVEIPNQFRIIRLIRTSMYVKRECGV